MFWWTTSESEISNQYHPSDEYHRSSTLPCDGKWTIIGTDLIQLIFIEWRTMAEWFNLYKIRRNLPDEYVSIRMGYPSEYIRTNNEWIELTWWFFRIFGWSYPLICRWQSGRVQNQRIKIIRSSLGKLHWILWNFSKVILIPMNLYHRKRVGWLKRSSKIRASWMRRSVIGTGFFFRCKGELGVGFLSWRSDYIRWENCIDWTKTTAGWNHGAFLYVFPDQSHSRVSSISLGFGNYVTCKWWNDLWLNEAMATWLHGYPSNPSVFTIPIGI